MALTFNKLNRQRLKRHRSKNKRGHVHSYQKRHKYNYAYMDLLRKEGLKYGVHF